MGKHVTDERAWSQEWNPVRDDTSQQPLLTYKLGHFPSVCLPSCSVFPYLAHPVVPFSAFICTALYADCLMRKRVFKKKKLHLTRENLLFWSLPPYLYILKRCLWNTYSTSLGTFITGAQKLSNFRKQGSSLQKGYTKIFLKRI